MNQFWQKTRRRIFPVVMWTVMLLWALIFLLLLGWGIMSSFKSQVDFILYPIGWPKEFKFDNYLTALQKINMLLVTKKGTRTVWMEEMFLNSILYAGGSAFFAVLSACIASYVIAKYQKYAVIRKFFALLVVILFLPVGSSLASQLKLLQTLGLYNSMIGMWIYQSGAFGGMFMIYYATFRGVSWSYAEAAFIDGASPFRVFFQIMFPMTKSIFGVLFLTTFINLWNDWQIPMVFLPSYPTIAYGSWKIQYSVDQQFAKVPLQLAGLTIVILPILLIFIIFQKKIMEGVSFGGLKG